MGLVVLIPLFYKVYVSQVVVGESLLYHPSGLSAFVLAVLDVLIVDLSKGLATLPDNYTSVDPKQSKQIQIETCGLVKYLLEGVDDVVFLRSFFLSHRT